MYEEGMSFIGRVQLLNKIAELKHDKKLLTSKLFRKINSSDAWKKKFRKVSDSLQLGEVNKLHVKINKLEADLRREKLRGLSDEV